MQAMYSMVVRTPDKDFVKTLGTSSIQRFTYVPFCIQDTFMYSEYQPTKCEKLHH